MFDLSIAIPTYNRAASLEKLLSNIAIQAQVSEVEIVISDNGSTDSTRSVVEQFEDRLNIRITGFDKNQGFDRNYLSCVAFATGQFVWVMGDDDALIPNALSKVLSQIRSDDADVLVYNGGDFRDGQLIPRVKYEPGALSNVGDLIDKLGWLICWIGTTIVRRRLIRTDLLKPEDSNAFVHLPLLVRSFRGNCKIKFSAEVLIHTTVNNSDYFKSPVALVKTFGLQLYLTLSQLSAENLMCRTVVLKTVRGFHKYLGMFGLRDMVGWRRAKLLNYADFLVNRKYFIRVNKYSFLSSLILLLPSGAIDCARYCKKRLAGMLGKT